MEAYCMKCKEKREAKDVQDVTMKNGKPAQEGVCPVCGTKMFRIGAAKPAEEQKEPAEAVGAAKVKGTAKGKAAKK